MRTVAVDADHSARFERTAKNVYRFQVVHTATGRHIAEGHCRRAGDPAPVEELVSERAREVLSLHTRQRVARSEAFAAGKPVPNAPRPPRVASDFDVPASAPVGLIQNAYRLNKIDGESIDSWRERCNRSAIVAGQKYLIGAPDDVILGIARGELTLNGSAREGVTVVRVNP